MIFKSLVISATVALLAAGIFASAYPAQKAAGIPSSHTYFAQVVNGVVTRVIVADQSFIDSGAVGDPTQWVQAGTKDVQASKGDSYDKAQAQFSVTSTLDTATTTSL